MTRHVGIRDDFGPRMAQALADARRALAAHGIQADDLVVIHASRSEERRNTYTKENAYLVVMRNDARDLDAIIGQGSTPLRAAWRVPGIAREIRRVLDENAQKGGTP